MKVRVIVNPVSGGGNGEVLARSLCAALERRGAETVLTVTKAPGDAGREAAMPGVDCVVAAGGDGTVRETANGLRGTGTPLAIFPLGTANAVAAQLKIPNDPEELAALIAEKRIRDIDCGVHRGQYFLQSAGAGLDALIVREVHARRGRRMSFSRYVAPVLRVVAAARLHPIRVTVDGRILCENARYAVVSDCPYSAGVFAFTPDATPDDGVLDVCAFTDTRMPRLLVLALASLGRGFSGRRDVRYAKGSGILLESVTGKPVALQIDGDPAGQLPASFTIARRALSVVAPE